MSDWASVGGRAWRRPVLTVLGRGRPEESALAACKMWPHPALGPQTSDLRCGVLPGCPYESCVTFMPS